MSMSCPEREVLLIVAADVLQSHKSALTTEQNRILQEFLDERPTITSPTKEKQLLDALDRYGIEQHLTIDMQGTLVLPLVDGVECSIPLSGLYSAPDVQSQTSTTRRAPSNNSSELDQPIWPHPREWDKPDD